jgi:hypothetical protein
MEKTKNCGNCKHLNGYGNDCRNCNSDFSNWEASEAVKQEYIGKINMEAQFNGTAAYDIVKKPKHYMLFSPDDLARMSSGRGVEVRDVIEKLLEKLGDSPKGEFYSYQFASDYVQMMQYLMRFMDKNGVEDLKKARWYLDKLIESY